MSIPPLFPAAAPAAAPPAAYAPTVLPPSVAQQSAAPAAASGSEAACNLVGLKELEDEEDARLLQESAAYEVNGYMSIDDDETT
ncbi:hypothetical protein V491_08488, partial [Pseudogymnoascus sp. VKM F-3775]